MAEVSAYVRDLVESADRVAGTIPKLVRGFAHEVEEQDAFCVTQLVDPKGCFAAVIICAETPELARIAAVAAAKAARLAE